METTVSALLERNRFSRKDIYRIYDPLLGWRNHVYVGRGKYGVQIKRPGSKDILLLDLFNPSSRVIEIKL